jgi:hypothetical protein
VEFKELLWHLLGETMAHYREPSSEYGSSHRDLDSGSPEYKDMLPT